MTTKTTKAKRSAKSRTPDSQTSQSAEIAMHMDTQSAEDSKSAVEGVNESTEAGKAVREPEPSQAAESEQEAKRGERDVGSVTTIAHAHAAEPAINERRAVMESIAQRMAAGESLTQICKEPGMPARYTVLRWAGDDPEVFNIYRTGLAMRAERYAEEIIDLADSARGKTSEEVQAIKLMVNSRQWVASRLLPKLYGDHQVIEHTGQVQMAPDQVDQRLAVLLRKMQAIEVKG